MKIAILGYGRQGKSIYEYFKDSHDITILDRQHLKDIPEGVKTVFGDNYINNLDNYDLIFRSPIIHPRDIVKANSIDTLDKVTSNTNRFFEDSPTKNIIGVTGTKGKGTTSSLITELLKGLGKNAYLGGNFGLPPLDLIRQGLKPSDWVVLELANFQLIDLKYSPHIAVCLIVEPEHLDWHVDEKEYYDSKSQLFMHQKASDIAIYYALNKISKKIASSGLGKQIPYFAEPGAIADDSSITIEGKEILKPDELQLLGRHNLQNVCAAVTAVWQIDKDIEKMAASLRKFKPLPFRIELVARVGGVSYYNDSFSSAPTSAMAAIETIKENKVLILGGKDRGIDLAHLCKVIDAYANSIRKILIIGEAGPRLADSLNKIGFIKYEVSDYKDMDSIVNRARDLARPGDAVVLSPGFPSFDMFLNFEDRGIKFNEAVKKL